MNIPFETLPMILVAPFIGSFLGVLVKRLPVGAPVLWGRSACPVCGHALGYADLVPVLSWLVQYARCRHCAARIDPFYPAIELAALGVALWSAALSSGWHMWAGCCLGWSLLALACIDWRHFILPDALTLPLIPGGLVVAWGVQPSLLPHHAAGVAAGFLSFAGIAWLYRRVRGQDGLGFGDVKLMAGAGAWLSWTGLPSVVLIAAIAAMTSAVFRAAGGTRLSAADRVPFGSYLCIAIWLVWSYGPLTV